MNFSVESTTFVSMNAQQLPTLSLYIETNSSFTIQVYVIVSLLNVLLVLQLISIGMRYKNQNFWLFKLVPSIDSINGSSNRRFILPNGINLFSICSVVFLIVLQKFLFEVKNCSVIDSDIKNSMLSRSLTWIPLFWAAWFFTWSTSLQPLISTTTLKNNLLVTYFSQRPILVNAFFIVAPNVFVTSIEVTSIILNSRFNTAFRLYRDLQKLLIGQSNNSNMTHSIQSEMDKLGMELSSSLTLAAKSWDLVFRLYYCGTAVLLFIFISATIIHIRVLGTALRSYSHTQTQTELQQRSSLPQINDLTTKSFDSLVWSYRTLVFTCVAIGFIAIVYLVVAVLTTLGPKKLLNSSTAIWLGEEFIILGAVYSYLIFGGATIFIVFIRSFIKPHNQCFANNNENRRSNREIEDITIVVQDYQSKEGETRVENGNKVKNENFDKEDLDLNGSNRMKGGLDCVESGSSINISK